MRSAWITGTEALRLRYNSPFQVATTEPEAEMPPYMESFLAHLRLLVGVPFEYMIPDPRMLPDESIRFFYLDRSWTDRLVDGAIAVGKIGTREQAHHQAHHLPVTQQLDHTERGVRNLQRGKAFTDVKQDLSKNQQPPAGIVTGFLLRSGAVAGWPTMDVRAYGIDIPEPLQPGIDPAKSQQLTTLRLERLSPAILLALFDGIPQLVFLEEPHHGVQFGVHTGRSQFEIDLRDETGHQIRVTSDPHSNPVTQSVPMRVSGNRVIAVASLRAALVSQRTTHPSMPEQKGSSAFAIEVLNPPWRQRFEGTVDQAETGGGSGGFVSIISIANRVAEVATTNAFESAITQVTVAGRRG
jgi:hypothetical protein